MQGLDSGFIVRAVLFAALFVGLLFVSSVITGWRSLANRYATKATMPAFSFLTSASLRGFGRYRYIRLGSDAENFYMSFWMPFAYPRVAIPWGDIEVQPATGFGPQTLRLGKESPVPCTTSSGNVTRLLTSAGRG